MGYIKQYKYEKLLLLPVRLRLTRKKKLSAQHINNKDCEFIIYYGGAIGDCVLATYFVSALKQQFPDSKVTFIGIPGANKLLDSIEEFSYVLKSSIFSVRQLKDIFSFKVWADFFKESAVISKHAKSINKYKVLICLNRMDTLLGVYKTRIIKGIIRNDYSIGLNSNNGRGVFFDNTVIDPGNLVEHLTTTWGRLLTVLTGYDVPVTYASQPTVRPEVFKNKLPLTERYCVIHTGGGSDATQTKWLNKRWSINNFYALADWIVKRYNCKVVFVGIAPEKDNSFDSLNRPDFVDLYGKTTIPELMNIIHNALFYVGNDSGLAHISSLLNVNTSVIWGYPSYIDYAPIAPNTQLVRLNLPCAPCLPFYDNRVCKDTDWEIKCIRSITLDMVKEKIEKHYNPANTISNN